MSSIQTGSDTGSDPGGDAGRDAGRQGGRRRLAWLDVLAVLLGWIVTLCVLITLEPPAGADSAPELVERAESALNAGDAEAFASLLGAPLDQEFATVYVERLQQVGAQNLTVTPGPDDLVTVSGQSPEGPFAFGLVAQEQDGRWFLTPLPPI